MWPFQTLVFDFPTLMGYNLELQARIIHFPPWVIRVFDTTTGREKIVRSTGHICQSFIPKTLWPLKDPISQHHHTGYSISAYEPEPKHVVHRAVSDWSSTQILLCCYFKVSVSLTTQDLQPQVLFILPLPHLNSVSEADSRRPVKYIKPDCQHE